MALSNTAVPRYYGQFREAVLRGEIPICREIEMEMNRIDALIDNPGVYYDDKAVEGWIRFCENELTLTDGSDLKLLDSFKLWGEQVFGWYYFVERSIWEPNDDGHGGRYVTKRIKKRLINKQYLVITRGAAKSMYDSFIQDYETYQLDVDRAEKNPAARNDILAKRFNIPMEGYTYFFTYEETLPHRRRDFWSMPCSLGGDLSQGDDFCAFTFLFPLKDGSFGIKCRSYISSLTLNKLPGAMRIKYEEFIKEGSLFRFLI